MNLELNFTFKFIFLNINYLSSTQFLIKINLLKINFIRTKYTLYIHFQYFMTCFMCLSFTTSFEINMHKVRVPKS
jgi:hypothetical protein